MRLVLLAALAMLAFAANSVLNRMAVGGGLVDPLAFALVRLASGAFALGLLVLTRGHWRGGLLWPGWNGRVAGASGLSVYLLGFSLAYQFLDAGTGALILFGVVQITMFGGAIVSGEAVPTRRWAGAGLALVGLFVFLAPSQASSTPLEAVGLMTLAGLGWGVYSLSGRGVQDPLTATAANFCLALPLCVAVVALWPGAWAGLIAEPAGLALAAVSGAVTSGMGYALWYAVVPRLGAARSAVAQLSVPLIAAAAGFVLLAEAPGPSFVLASALVLGGIAWASLPSTPRAGAVGHR